MNETKSNHLLGFALLLGTFALGWGVWHVFFAPNGILKLYTPMYGFALIAAYFLIVVVMTDVFGLRNEAGKPARALLLTLVSFLGLFVLFYGFFWNFLGRFGVTYFSPHAIVAAGGTGAEFYNARENSSLAIVYLAASFLWIIPAWRAGVGEELWHECGRAKAGIANFFGIAFFAGLAYLILFHPHVTSLFYPAQTFAGVPPWWEGVAMTASAYFNLGWLLTAVFLLLLVESAWEGRPASLLPKDGMWTILSPSLMLAGSAVAGYLLFLGMEAVMNLFWEEPFLGGSYVDAPYFRHLHVAEMSGFFIMGLVIWRVFFRNAPGQLPPMARWVVRTLAVIAIGLLLRWFYYSEGIGTAFLDRVPGLAQPDDTPLAWTLMMLSLMLVYDRFFNAYLLREKTR
ncbi:MAG: hypothetical protein IH614_11610 [Desulfuromonadales bacterium]|nr:hypothetical protein [Desulfuromonadales bacterium]